AMVVSVVFVPALRPTAGHRSTALSTTHEATQWEVFPVSVVRTDVRSLTVEDHLHSVKEFRGHYRSKTSLNINSPFLNHYSARIDRPSEQTVKSLFAEFFAFSRPQS